MVFALGTVSCDGPDGESHLASNHAYNLLLKFKRERFLLHLGVNQGRPRIIYIQTFRDQIC